ncbi:MAG: shikimate dehydrogenase [Blautia sp.]
MIPITGHTKLTGLLGSPVEHSISPMMHNTAFQALGLDYVYLCFDVNEAGLGDAVKGLKTMGIRGFNLTMPNKNKILEYLDELSPAAECIGAVNTVENQNGKLIGHNTDGIGFMRAAAENGIQTKEKTMTLMGIGGAATAICAQAALDGVGTIHIFARSTSRYLQRMKQMIRQLSEKSTCQIVIHPNEDQKALREALHESVLLVNATSVGMAPDTEASIIPHASFLRPDLAVADIIYNPWETKLLAMAREAGCRAFNGYGMLIHQGAEAFKIWTGQEMPVDLVRKALGKD